MKYDAIVDQGILIHERVPIPERLIPEDSRVEIDAKIYAGYFTNEKVPRFVYFGVISPIPGPQAISVS